MSHKRDAVDDVGEVRKAWLNLLSCRGREIPPPAVVSEYATHTYESGWGNPDLKVSFCCKHTDVVS